MSVTKIRNCLLLLVMCFGLICGVDVTVTSNVVYAIEDINLDTDPSTILDEEGTKEIIPEEDQTSEVDHQITSPLTPVQEEPVPTVNANEEKAKKTTPAPTPEPKNEGFFSIVLAVGVVFNFIVVILVLAIVNRRINNINNRINSMLINKSSSTNTQNNKYRQTTTKSTEERILDNSTITQSKVKEDSRASSGDLANVPTYNFNEHDDSNRYSDSSSGRLNFARQSIKKNELSTTQQRQIISATRELNDSEFTGSPDYSNQHFTAQKNTVVSLTREFKDMLDEVSKKGSWEGQTIIDEFAAKYAVIAFKCVNSSMRVNHPELPPQFEQSTLDNKLWGIPIDGGRLVIFPNPSLSDYEYSIHYQGGMKELFKVLVAPNNTNYERGNYRNIKLILPAIVSDNFENIQRGELRLI